MSRRKPQYVISIQSTQGLGPARSFKISGFKAEKIFDLIQSDFAKNKKKTEATSVTLERFFQD